MLLKLIATLLAIGSALTLVVISGETLKDEVLGETKDEDKETVSVDYAGAKLNAYSKLFNYIRNELFENKEIIDLSKLNEMLIGFMKDGAVQE